MMGKSVEVALLMVITVICLVVLASAWQDCNAEGGVLVRGLFTMECIQR